MINIVTFVDAESLFDNLLNVQLLQDRKNMLAIDYV